MAQVTTLLPMTMSVKSAHVTYNKMPELSRHVPWQCVQPSSVGAALSFDAVLHSIVDRFSSSPSRL